MRRPHPCRDRSPLALGRVIENTLEPNTLLSPRPLEARRDHPTSASPGRRCDNYSGYRTAHSTGCRSCLADLGRDIGPMRGEPRQGVGSAHDALETAPGRILKRFFLKSRCHVLHQFVEATVTWTVLKSTRDRGGGPRLPSEMDDAL